MADIVKRSGRLPFYQVDDSFRRMLGFTELSTSKKPTTYSRRYIDEDFERSDIVGYSTEIAYSFDMFTGDAVHEDIAAIADGELLGAAAVRTLVLVDFTKPADNGGYVAVKRSFTVVPDSEGDSTDAYTYSGSMKAADTPVQGTAKSEDDWQTCTFE